MDKISSILPSNARVTSVDLNEAPPARPGSPSAGRKTGRNTVADRVTVSQQAKDLASGNPLTAKQQREVSRAKMVEEINRNFFSNRLKSVEKEAPKSAEVAEQVMDTEEMVSMRPEETVTQYEPKVDVTPKLSIEA